MSLNSTVNKYLSLLEVLFRTPSFLLNSYVYVVWKRGTSHKTFFKKLPKVYVKYARELYHLCFNIRQIKDLTDD